MTGVTISRLDLSESDFESAFARLMVSPAEADPDLSLAVSRIVADVAKEGDRALLRLTNELDDRDVSDACLLYTSPSPRDATLSRMPSSA